jgi:hypothetical protein
MPKAPEHEVPLPPPTSNPIPHPPPSEEIVVPLRSDTVEQLEENVGRIVKWAADYRRQHGL